MIDTLTEVWGVIRRNKLRTIATGFAVSSGLFMVIGLQGAANGITHTLDYNTNNLALDVTTVYPGNTSKSFDGLKEGRSIKLDARDEQLARDNFPGVVTATGGIVRQAGITLSAGSKSVLNMQLYGCTPKNQQTNSVTMKHGRFINDVDLEEHRKVVVLMERNAKSLFGQPEKALDQWVSANGIMYKVVGICKDSESAYVTLAYAPFTTVQLVYNKGKHLDEMTLITPTVQTQEDAQAFTTKMRRAMSVLHRFDPDDKGAVWIISNADTAGTISLASKLIHTAFWILGLLTLLSGITGVSNIMLISVKERTHEFGIRRAIGAKPRNLIGMVIMESVLITAIFGYIGMVGGIAFTEYLDAAEGDKTMELAGEKVNYFLNPTVDMSICIEATFVMIAAGTIAGFIPARKAAKVKPIEALREA